MYQVYGFSPFDRSGKVRWLLEELGLPFEVQTLDFERGDHEQPDFMILNPMGAVPVLRGPDIAPLHESNGICAFLADRHLEGALAPPLDSPLRAKYAQWMHFATGTLECAVQVYGMAQAIHSATTSQAVVATTIAQELGEAQDRLSSALRTLELGLGDRDYLLGAQFSAADVVIGYCLFWRQYRGELAGFPKLENYFERLRNRPAAIRVNVFNYPRNEA